MKRTIALTFAFCTTVCCIAQTMSAVDSVFDEAGKSGRPVLLVFSGSDWCAPCIRFEKQIASTPEFHSFERTHLVMLKADFPQRHKLSTELKQQNDFLAERYNPQGTFPLLLLLRPDRTVLQILDYKNESPEMFIDEIRTYLNYESAEGKQTTR